MKALTLLSATGVVFLPVMGMTQQSAAPSDAELTQHKVQALSAEMTYAQALIARLTAELAASEARGKWAANKLWQVPESAK